MRRLIVALILAFATSATAQTVVQCKINGAFAPCTAPLLNTYPNWASPGAIGSGTATTVRGTTITATTQFSGSGAGLTALPAASITGCSSTSTVLVGGSPPACAAVPDAALSANIVTLTGSQILTNKTLNCALNSCLVRLENDVSGTLGVTFGGTGQSGSLTAHGTLVGEGTSGIVAVSPGTAGQVLTSAGASADPTYQNTVTATNGAASLSSSPYNVASGSYASIGLALSLPSAGTYLLTTDLRTVINASVGAGGFIECQLYNTTDAAAIANSERIGAYENAVSLQFYGQISINEIVTVASAKTIDVQCLRTGATSYNTAAVYSDTNGRSRFSYVKVSP